MCSQNDNNKVKILLKNPIIFKYQLALSPRVSRNDKCYASLSKFTRSTRFKIFRTEQFISMRYVQGGLNVTVQWKIFPRVVKR